MGMEAELSWRLQRRNRSLLCEHYTYEAEAVATTEELSCCREHAWNMVPTDASSISYHCSCTKTWLLLFAMAGVNGWPILVRYDTSHLDNIYHMLSDILKCHVLEFFHSLR